MSSTLSQIPKSLYAIVCAILCVPLLAWGSFHYFYPNDPDLVYSHHGKLNMEWEKFAQSNTFTEYLAKHRVFDDETLSAEILVLRNYKEPQTSFYDHDRVVYSSVVIHQLINCRSRTVNIQDMLLFSGPLSKGKIVKDVYDLDYDMGAVTQGSIDEMKVQTLCNISS
jgi:hypothetical protein